MATPAAVLSVLVQARGIAQTQAQLKRLNASADDTAKHTDEMASKFRGVNGALGDFNRAMTSTRNAVTLVKWPAMIAGAGAATQAVNALAAGAVGLGAAMAPLAGLGAATGVAYTAVGQAMGVAKLATMGMTDAINGQKGAMDKLSPVQQAFVKQIRGLKEETQGLRGAAQRGLLPGLSEGLTKVIPLINTLKPIVGATARVMGDLAARSGALVASWKGDLLTVGRANVKIIGNIGTAALSAANAARNLIAAAAPLAVWLSKLVADGAKWVSVQVSAARQSGQLAQFFERTASVVGRLIQIAQNLGGAFLNIGKAAFPLGDKLLTDFTLLTAKFRAWTDSAGGQNKIAAYFKAAQEPLYATFRLIRDVGKAFFSIGDAGGGSLAPLIDQIRTQLLPALTGILKAGSAGGANFLSQLIKTASDLLVAFTPLLGPSGPLTLFLKLVDMAARAMTSLQNTVPGAAQAMGVLGGAMSVLSAVGMSRFISQNLGVQKGLQTVKGVITSTAGAYRALAAGQTVSTAAQKEGLAATLAAKTAQLAVAAATKVWSAAQLALNIVMRANPFVLIATLVIALGAAMVLAYQKSETFRNIVNAVFNALKTAAGAVVGFLSSFGQIPAVMAAAGGAIIHGIVDGLKALGGVLADAAKWLLDTYVRAVKALIGGYVAVGGWILHRIIDGVKGAAAALVAIGTWIKNRVMDGLNAVVGAVKAVGSWVIHRVVDGLKAEGAIVLTVGGWLKNRIMDGLNAAVSAVKSLGSWVIHRIIDGLKADAKLVGDVAGWVKNRIMDGFNAIKGAITNIGGTILGWIVDGLKNDFKILGDFLIAILKVLDHIPGVNTEGAQKTIAKLTGAGADKKAEGGVYGLAHGGAFRRTGGVVSRPITLMGEEAPRHPEFVIPTNPAYRGRAQGLLSQAAGAIGMASGGVYSFGEIQRIWTQAGGDPSRAQIMAHIALAESSGNTNAHNASGASGLWQILGLPFSGNPFDPATNARMAIAKSSNGRNLHPWDASRSAWERFLGGNPSGGGGILGAIGDLAGKALDAIGGSVEALLGKLPGVDSLPDWLQGTGKWVLSHATKWIKDKLDSILPGGGGGGAEGGEGVQDAIRVAKSIADKHMPYQYGGGHGRIGVGNPSFDCSGYVSAILHGLGVLNTPMAVREPMASALMPGPGKKVTVGIRGTSGMNAHTMIKLGGRYFESGGGHGPAEVGGWDGSFQYFHPGGFRKGGKYGPYMGAYKNGGVLPNDGLYYGHKGEAVVPMARGSVFSSRGIPAMLSRPGPATPSYIPPPAPAVDETPYSQADIDGLNDQISDLNGQIAGLNGQIAVLNDTIDSLNRQLELQRQQYAEVQRNYNVSQSQYTVLAKAIADVANGQIGGRVGLGFMSPGFSGGGVRY